ncbi:MAG: HdeD family acid-resistance protein [Acutalibacteraceae bacterium]
MKKLKKKMSDKTLNVITGAIIAFLGLLVLVFPDSSLMTLCYILGAATLIGGIFRIVQYVKDKKETFSNPIDLISGIVLLGIAFMFLLHPKFLMSILPFFIGISVVVYGISSFFSGKSGLFGKIFSAVVAIYGVTLMFNPFKAATTITSLVGFGFLVFGIVKIIGEAVFNKRPDFPDDIDGDGYIEVDYKDV